jgi:hypothetical protein
MASRITRFFRGNVIGFIALFFALSGGAAYANDTIFSTDIVDGEVKSVDVGNSELTGADVKDGTIWGLDILNNSIGSADVIGLDGGDIDDNGLTGADVTGLGGGDVNNNSLTGSDIDEASLSMGAMGCKTGKVLGFARVHGTAGIPGFYTNAPEAIDITNNCSGGDVKVRRAGQGLYFVRFSGNPALLALAVSNSDGAALDSTHNDNIVSVAKVTSGSDAGAFRVEVEDIDEDASGGSDPQDGQFTIMLP